MMEGLPPNIRDIQNTRRQNHVGGKVALIRRAWVCDDWRDS